MHQCPEQYVLSQRAMQIKDLSHLRPLLVSLVLHVQTKDNPSQEVCKAATASTNSPAAHRSAALLQLHHLPSAALPYLPMLADLCCLIRWPDDTQPWLSLHPLNNMLLCQLGCNHQLESVSWLCLLVPIYILKQWLLTLVNNEMLLSTYQ